MNRYIFMILACGLCMSCSDNGENITPEDPSEFDEITEQITDLSPLSELNFTADQTEVNNDINDFSNKFFFNAYNDLRDENGNIVVSPVSATICLSMLANSSDEKFQREFVNALGVDNLTELNDVCNQLLRHLPCDAQDNVVSLINGVWYQTGYHPKSSFVRTMNGTYGAEVNPVDFADPGTVDFINAWCADKTHNLINDILDMIDPGTRIMFANAAYFSNKWEYPINYTDEGQFYGTKITKDVTMLHYGNYGRYKETDYAKIAFVDFENPAWEMVFILPKEGKTMSSVSKSLTNEAFETTQDDIAYLSMIIPKFTYSFKQSYESLLNKLGISTSNLKIPVLSIDYNGSFGIIQQCYIDVNETGVTAAAVTISGTLIFDSGPSNIKELCLDHPFIFAIRHRTTGSILMQGVISNL